MILFFLLILACECVIIEVYDDLYDRIVHAHFKDWRHSPTGAMQRDGILRFEGCAVGNGFLPLDELISKMRADKYRGTDAPLFQLLIYPVTDSGMQTDSAIKYTDTPMWNAKLSEKMWREYIQGPTARDIAYASPMAAERFDSLPNAYLETAEFDCLHDEGGYEARASRLKKGGDKIICDGMAKLLFETDNGR